MGSPYQAEKSILLSQYTYLGAMLDMTDSQLEKIQNQLNYFVLENTDSTDVNEKSNNWIKAELMYAMLTREDVTS